MFFTRPSKDKFLTPPLERTISIIILRELFHETSKEVDVT